MFHSLTILKKKSHVFITLQLHHNTLNPILMHIWLDSINPNSINSNLEQQVEGQENKVEEQMGSCRKTTISGGTS